MNTHHFQTSLILNYGVDSLPCPTTEVKVSELGISFFSRWNFVVGTEFSIGLANHSHHSPLPTLTLSALVVRSERLPDHQHATTLLFLDLPDSLRPQLRAFSQTLAAA